MILLDTNALIWVEQGHRRIKPLLRLGLPLAISPVSLLELQFLAEADRIAMPKGFLQDIIDDDRWMLDEPSALEWFDEAIELAWTRDPFDRLLAAHARIRRWRLATADARLLEALGPADSIEV